MGTGGMGMARTSTRSRRKGLALLRYGGKELS
ncbi:MAG: hypothetical protein ACI841_004651 [Planctomycetota bacterium]|jgi:hypothetical protein